MRHTYPTQRVGDTTLVRLLAVSPVFCRVGSIIGFNNGADTYILVFEQAAEPANGTKAAFHCLADAGRSWAIALPNVVEMSACFVAASSTLDTYTAVAGTPVTIQALLAV